MSQKWLVFRNGIIVSSFQTREECVQFSKKQMRLSKVKLTKLMPKCWEVEGRWRRDFLLMYVVQENMVEAAKNLLRKPIEEWPSDLVAVKTTKTNAFTVQKNGTVTPGIESHIGLISVGQREQREWDARGDRKLSEIRLPDGLSAIGNMFLGDGCCNHTLVCIRDQSGNRGSWTATGLDGIRVLLEGRCAQKQGLERIHVGGGPEYLLLFDAKSSFEILRTGFCRGSRRIRIEVEVGNNPGVSAHEIPDVV